MNEGRRDMKRQKKNRQLNKSYQSDRGVALIMAVVIISILIIFTFSLMLVAYSLYSSQNKNVAVMRCSEAANTLSAALCEELTWVDQDSNRYPELDSYLYRYLRYNLCQADTWPYYDSKNAGEHGKDKAFRYFELKHNTAKKVYSADGSIEKSTDESGNPVDLMSDGVEGMPGKTTVCIYWEPPTGMDLSDNASKMASKDGLILHLDVTCESASQSYTVEKKLRLKVYSYKPLQDLTDRGRQDAISDAADNPAVNPCGFNKDVDIDVSELWSWELMNE